MKRTRIVLKDSDYFRDNEDVIKLEFCKNEGDACKVQMRLMNDSLVLARKFIEKKEYKNALQEIKNAYFSTSELQDLQCLKCADLFRDIILKSLEKIVTDLKKLTRGFWGNKNYLFDLSEAEKLYETLKNS
jgi:hypothetical protein